MDRLIYAREPALGVEEFRRVLVESGLGALRPIDDKVRLAAMLAASGLVVTARDAGVLVGLARCVTDFTWCCYVSDLAVTAAAQGLGAGRGLLDAVRRELGPSVSVILASVPDAVGFYERAGMARVPDAFWWRRSQ